eukprot:Trichotokara_eunicae@DN5417_c0_g1_i5.p1
MEGTTQHVLTNLLPTVHEMPQPVGEEVDLRERKPVWVGVGGFEREDWWWMRHYIEEAIGPIQDFELSSTNQHLILFEDEMTAQKWSVGTMELSLVGGRERLCHPCSLPTVVRQ